MTELKKKDIVKKKIILFGALFLSLLSIIYLGFNKNIDKKSSPLKTNIEKNYEKEDKDLLLFLDNNKGKVITLNGIDIYIDKNFNGESLKGFPKKKESLDKLLSKLKGLGLNNKNTNFTIVDKGDLPGPFLSVIATDKEKRKSIEQISQEINKGIEKIKEIDNETASIFEDTINNEKLRLANKDSVGFCISSSSLDIKGGSSVQVCPDETTMLKMTGENNLIVKGTPKVDTLLNMPYYTKDNIDNIENGFQKIYNIEAYIIKYPYVLKYKNVMLNYTIPFYKNILGLDKMIYDNKDNDLYLKYVLGTNLKIIGYNFEKNEDIKKSIEKNYEEYKKEFDRLNKKNKNKEIVSYLQFENDILLNLEIFKIIKGNINAISSLSNIIIKPEISSNIRNINNVFIKQKYIDIVKDNNLYKKLKEEQDLTKEEFKRVSWFYSDTVNFLPNIIVLFYPETKEIINFIKIEGLDNVKYKTLFSMGYLINENNSKNSFIPFLYDLNNGGIILEPKDSELLNFKDIWEMINNEEYKKMQEEVLNRNKKILQPNKLCQKAIKIREDEQVDMFYDIYKCYSGNFILDLLDKNISKITKRANLLFSMFNTKKGIIPFLSDDKYIILVKLYPDILYWRFDTPKERENFFKDFKDAYEILSSSTDKEAGLSKFNRKMIKYYKYFNDKDDYKHLRGNLNTLNLIIYGQ